jgi:hypothetical protein
MTGGGGRDSDLLSLRLRNFIVGDGGEERGGGAGPSCDRSTTMQPSQTNRLKVSVSTRNVIRVIRVAEKRRSVISGLRPRSRNKYKYKYINI